MQSGSDITALDDFLDLVLVKEGLAKKVQPPKPEKDKVQFKATQKREIDLWHNWNNNGRKPEHLKPLYESFKPLLQREANKFRTLEIPKSAISAEIRKQFVNAVKSYDPKRATQLNSWITTNLQKSSRFIKTYQNLGKIPEGQISKIREYKQAKETLFNKMGYEPDTEAIAEHLKWPRKRVAQLQKELRKDLSASGFPTDPAEILTPKELEAIRIIQFDNRLSKDERSVYEYTFGINGKAGLQPGQIAKQTGLQPSKVSRIRSKLKDYVQEAMDVL